MRARAQIAFDSNLAGVAETRAFWGTLCEEIGQRMMLTPTAASEVTRRVRLESERAGKKKLKRINAEQGMGWSKVEVQRLATTAGNAARDRFKEELEHQGAIYARAPRRDGRIEALEAEIDDEIDERAFDLTTATGINDRKIVVEAMARGYDIVASNNINSIKHGILREWIRTHGAPKLDIKTSILRPEPAEEALRQAYGKPIEWTAFAAARACVSNPYEKGKAAKEIGELLDAFDERGMGAIKDQIETVARSPKVFAEMLERVARHGASLAMREERSMRNASSQAVSRRAGASLDLE